MSRACGLRNQAGHRRGRSDRARLVPVQAGQRHGRTGQVGQAGQVGRTQRPREFALRALRALRSKPVKEERTAMAHDDSTASTDRALGMDRAITRRDFLNGVAIGVGGALASQWLPDYLVGAQAAAQDSPGYYPPALTGMRGSHDGSFDVVACAARRPLLGARRHAGRHRRDLRSGGRRRRHQRPRRGVFLPRARRTRKRGS